MVRLLTMRITLCCKVNNMDGRTNQFSLILTENEAIHVTIGSGRLCSVN